MARGGAEDAEKIKLTNISWRNIVDKKSLLFFVISVSPCLRVSYAV